MLIPIPQDVLQAQARERTLDTVLGSLGVSAAVAAVAFAGYMAVVGPGATSMSSPAPLLAVAGAPTHAPRTIAALPPAARDTAAPELGGIDFDPTGSIVPVPAPAAAEPPAAGTGVLQDFAVRDAFDGTALVEAHGKLHMVTTGATIDGAGRVLSVARRGAGWVVATTGGLILQRR